MGKFETCFRETGDGNALNRTRQKQNTRNTARKLKISDFLNIVAGDGDHSFLPFLQQLEAPEY